MYSLMKANKIRTFVLFMIIFSVIIGMGAGLAYMGNDIRAAFWFIGIIGLITMFVFFSSTSSLLKLVHGQQLDLNNLQHKQLYNVIENLCITAGMPVPTIYIIPDSGFNAFASGLSPNKAIVGVTQGLLDNMDKKQIEAVMGHELSHIRNYDTRVNVMAYAVAVALLLVGEILIRTRGEKNPLPLLGLAILIVGYPAIFLTRLAISRQREYLADVGSVELTRDPEAMASALQVLRDGPKAQIPNSVSHMFISNGGRQNWFKTLFSTHPDLDKRIERVRDSFTHM